MKRLIISLLMGAWCVMGATTSVLAKENPPQTTVDIEIRQFLKGFGWTETGKGAVSHLRMPANFLSFPNGYPLGLFWNKANVLSQDAGLNMSPYLGEEVAVHIVPLKQKWVGPNAVDGIVVTYQSKIIGAWLRAGFMPMGSLRRHQFNQVIHETWSDWLASQGYVNYQRANSVIANSASPTQVIRSYFSALNHHQYQTAFQLTTFGFQLNMINPNADRLSRAIYLSQSDTFSAWFSNIVYWHLKRISLNTAPVVKMDRAQVLSDGVYAYREYNVLFTAKYKKVIAVGNGPGGYTFVLIKETPNSPWRIGGYGND